jgi:hypothetical protein
VKLWIDYSTEKYEIVDENYRWYRPLSQKGMRKPTFNVWRACLRAQERAHEEAREDRSHRTIQEHEPDRPKNGTPKHTGT